MVNKLYTYIITVDNGLSPCYDSGLFSLACCKPQIRRMIYLKYSDAIKSENANIWIMGIRRDKGNDKKPFVVYLAKITDVLKLEEYYSNESIYVDRKDCNYRGVNTLNDLPIALDSEDISFKKFYPNIKALKNNEHGSFNNVYELYRINRHNRKAIMKDICGKAVLMSSQFIHCSQIDLNDKYALTKMLQPCLNILLDDYYFKNQRHNYSFDNWEEFYQIIQKIDFKARSKVLPLENSDCIKEYKAKICSC